MSFLVNHRSQLVKHTLWISAAVIIAGIIGGVSSVHAQSPQDSSGASTANAPADPKIRTQMNGISFSDYQGFEKTWKMVTVRFRKDTGELRFVYANPIAWDALQSGVTDYPEGAIFAKIGIATEDDPKFGSSAIPAATKRFQFMVRNKAKYADTNGWGFALFNVNGLTELGHDGKAETAACNACHNIVPERGYVFSVPMGFNWSTANNSSPLNFHEDGVDSLPKRLRQSLPSTYRRVHMLTGEVQKNLFQGTLDEIRPTLANHAVKSGLPSVLLSQDSQAYVMVFVSATDTTCRKKGMVDLRAVSTFHGGEFADQNPTLLHSDNFCWKSR